MVSSAESAGDDGRSGSRTQARRTEETRAARAGKRVQTETETAKAGVLYKDGGGRHRSCVVSRVVVVVENVEETAGDVAGFV